MKIKIKKLLNTINVILISFLTLTCSCTSDENQLVFSDKADIYLDAICNDLDSLRSEELKHKYTSALLIKSWGDRYGRLKMVEEFNKTAENLTFRDLLRAMQANLDVELEKEDTISEQIVLPEVEEKNYTVQSFAEAVRNKYPESEMYKSMSDEDLTNAVVEKYPVYKDQIDFNDSIR